MNGYKFEIRDASGGQYYWRFRAPNGEVMCHSENYTTKAAAQNAVASVKRNAADASVVDLTGVHV